MFISWIPLANSVACSEVFCFILDSLISCFKIHDVFLDCSERAHSEEHAQTCANSSTNNACPHDEDGSGLELTKVKEISSTSSLTG